MTALLATGAVGANAMGIGDRIPEFVLEDQYGDSVSFKKFEGRVFVLLASDKEGSEQNGPWKKALISRYNNSIALMGIADVSTVPSFMTGLIKSRFKKDEGRVLMDWKAEVFKALGLKKKVSNIVVVDQKGNLRYITSGAGTEEAIAKLFAEIDGLK
jgi:hypothetical protein